MLGNFPSCDVTLLLQLSNQSQERWNLWFFTTNTDTWCYSIVQTPQTSKLVVPALVFRPIYVA